jgi:RNA polymerase sigma-70 factor (ECF subfamily)
MDRLELEQRILDKTIDPLEKYKDLWEYYRPRLLIYIKSFKKIPSSEHTDVVSDILLKTFNNLHKYNQLYSLSTWVYNIAKNYALDLYRKTSASLPAFSDDKIDEQTVKAGEQDSIVDAIIQNDIIEKCRKCIETLNEKDKRLVFLRYYEGLNSREISLVEGISRSAVRRRLMVIKSHIKKLLGDDYGY